LCLATLSFCVLGLPARLAPAAISISPPLIYVLPHHNILYMRVTHLKQFFLNPPDFCAETLKFLHHYLAIFVCYQKINPVITDMFAIDIKPKGFLNFIIPDLPGLFQGVKLITITCLCPAIVDMPFPTGAGLTAIFISV